MPGRLQWLVTFACFLLVSHECFALTCHDSRLFVCFSVCHAANDPETYKAGFGSTPVSHMYMQCCTVAVVAVDASSASVCCTKLRCWHNEKRRDSHFVHCIRTCEECACGNCWSVTVRKLAAGH